jgi:hypothetical protein
MCKAESPKGPLLREKDNNEMDLKEVAYDDVE